MRAVLFDLDQTLYPEADYVRSGFREVSRFVSAQLGENSEAVEAELLTALRSEGRGRVFDRLLEKPERTGRLSVETLLHVYRTHRPVLWLHADAEMLLENLPGPLGLVTDGHATTQWQKIGALGLVRPMKAIVCTADLGPAASKPNETGFRVCLERLGICPFDAAYVGDDPAKDFLAPQKLGMRTVRVVRKTEAGFGWTTPGVTTEADLTVTDLRNAMEFLQ